MDDSDESDTDQKIKILKANKSQNIQGIVTPILHMGGLTVPFLYSGLDKIFTGKGWFIQYG